MGNTIILIIPVITIIMINRRLTSIDEGFVQSKAEAEAKESLTVRYTYLI